MKISTGLLISAALLVLIGQSAGAHGDKHPLFVATGGQDAGQCINPEQPCGSLTYALKMVGKAGQIRIAAGTYPVASTEELFLLISGSVEVIGGFENDGSFQFASAQSTTLTGVPYEFRDLLKGHGIHVIADRKDQDPERSAQTQKLLALNAQIQSSMAAAPCTGGLASGLPCDSMDLLSHVAFSDISARPSSAADVWGFVDLNTLREYAIVGFRTGTAVVDVTDAENPLEVGYVFGQSASWRDIKVYQFYNDAQNRWNAYAYVTTDGANDGLYVIDMTRLPHSIQRTNYTSDFSSAHNVYVTNTDYATGVSITGAAPQLIIAGANIGVGQFRSYSLENPEAPQFVASPSGAGYMHDASSMLISDSRKDSQCVNASAYCEILMDFNENQIDIWDISRANSPSRLGAAAYSGASYVHSGWWSEDRQYMFAHDELDEQRHGLQTTVRVFSMADLRNPTLVGSWTGVTNAIDHNGFVRGNRYYMSNYSRGLTVLDISNSTNPVAVGRLDTYPFSDSSGFVGAWGTYPFFHSGNVAISDIGSGMYMAKDMTRQVAQGSFAFAQLSYGVTEGDQASIAVSRLGGGSGSVSVDIEIVGASADQADLSSTTTTLSWGNGDVAAKIVDVTAVSDGLAEPLEQALIRLIAPQGGATLADASTAHLFISDSGAATELEFLDPIIDVAERDFTTALLTVSRKGSAAGDVSIDIERVAGDAVSGADYIGSDSSTLSWTDGDARPQTIELIMLDDGVNEQSEFVEFQLMNPAAASIGPTNTVRVNIGNGSNINHAPNAVAGADQRVLKNTVVTLNGSQSDDDDGDALTYRWEQLSGTSVSLSNEDTSMARFTAPPVNAELVLQLTVSDPSGQRDTSTVKVTVSDSTSQPTASGGSSGGSVGVGFLALLLLTSLMRVLRVRAIRQTGDVL